jgi:hypothetical protein
MFSSIPLPRGVVIGLRMLVVFFSLAGLITAMIMIYRAGNDAGLLDGFALSDTWRKADPTDQLLYAIILLQLTFMFVWTFNRVFRER